MVCYGDPMSLNLEPRRNKSGRVDEKRQTRERWADIEMGCSEVRTFDSHPG